MDSNPEKEPQTKPEDPFVHKPGELKNSESVAFHLVERNLKSHVLDKTNHENPYTRILTGIIFVLTFGFAVFLSENIKQLAVFALIWAVQVLYAIKMKPRTTMFIPAILCFFAASILIVPTEYRMIGLFWFFLVIGILFVVFSLSEAKSSYLFYKKSGINKWKYSVFALFVAIIGCALFSIFIDMA